MGDFFLNGPLLAGNCQDILYCINPVNVDFACQFNIQILQKWGNDPGDADKIFPSFSSGNGKQQPLLPMLPTGYHQLCMVSLAAVNDQLEPSGHRIGIDRGADNEK